jgi:hypothetical protein
VSRASQGEDLAGHWVIGDEDEPVEGFGGLSVFVCDGMLSTSL